MSEAADDPSLLAPADGRPSGRRRTGSGSGSRSSSARSRRWPSSARCRRPPRRRCAAAAERGSAAIIDPARIEEIEATTRHDVIAFLTHLEEVIGPEARYLHLGMTSSDLLDTALRLPAHPGGRPPARRSRPAARGAAPPRLRAQGHALHRPLARHACRAHHLRPQARRLPSPSSRATGAGSRPRATEIATCAISGAVGTFANVDPGGRGQGRRAARPAAGADLDPGDPARPPRRVLRHARRGRERHRAPRDRDPPSAAHRGRRGRRAVRRAARRAARRCRTSAIRG